MSQTNEYLDLIRMLKAAGAHSDTPANFSLAVSYDVWIECIGDCNADPDLSPTETEIKRAAALINAMNDHIAAAGVANVPPVFIFEHEIPRRDRLPDTETIALVARYEPRTGGVRGDSLESIISSLLKRFARIAA